MKCSLSCTSANCLCLKATVASLLFTLTLSRLIYSHPVSNVCSKSFLLNILRPSFRNTPSAMRTLSAS